MAEIESEQSDLPLDDVYEGKVEEFSAEVIMKTRDMALHRLNKMMDDHAQGLKHIPSKHKSLPGSHGAEMRIFSIEPGENTDPSIKHEIDLLNHYIVKDSNDYSHSDTLIAYKDFQLVNGAEIFTKENDISRSAPRIKIFLESTDDTNTTDYQHGARILTSESSDCSNNIRKWNSEFKDLPWKILQEATYAKSRCRALTEMAERAHADDPIRYGKPSSRITTYNFDIRSFDDRFSKDLCMNFETAIQHLRPSKARSNDDMILNMRFPSKDLAKFSSHYGVEESILDSKSEDWDNEFKPTTKKTVTIRWSRVLNRIDDPQEYLSRPRQSSFEQADRGLQELLRGVTRIVELDDQSSVADDEHGPKSDADLPSDADNKPEYKADLYHSDEVTQEGESTNNERQSRSSQSPGTRIFDWMKSKVKQSKSGSE
ncbi:uncharacterized protein I206_105083 [Kwoniella pini CBS 10737]|uniref:Uncharacterized protein n=1 Tax=Kwoniella pini CBS 10737 TaxID=1296096 RepID=A0A1B9I8N2_9TREE|nr:uncharacterized protein I206_02623 [Kwoniella pini CBS 10737]OCF51907.1 hypothetical protein I206_02623 [Kwoniella pini CBS 10737]